MQAFKLFKGQHIPKFNATTFHVNGQYKLNNNWRQFTTAQPSPAIEMKTNLDAPKDFVNTNDFFRNRKVLLVGIVGAFTGVCDNQLPPYAKKLEEFKKKGIDEIAVVYLSSILCSVDQVLKAFGDSIGVHGNLTFLADFDCSYTKALGMEVDLTAAKFGKRSKRYAMLVDNGSIVKSWVEEKPSDLKVSAAESVLKNI